MCRATRRHHRQRRIAKWHRLNPPAPREYAAVNEKEYRRIAPLRFATTSCNCSCWMCGNPRRRYGNSLAAKTRQEIVADLALSEDL